MRNMYWRSDVCSSDRANGCNAIYLKELSARIEALAAPAEGGEVVIVDCPACMGRGYQGTGIDAAPTTTCRACDGTGAVDEDGLIDSAGGAKDDFCTTAGHVTGGTDSGINCGDRKRVVSGKRVSLGEDL